jgi:hypothetical protein
VEWRRSTLVHMEADTESNALLTVREEASPLSALRSGVWAAATTGSSCCFLAGLQKNESMVRLVAMLLGRLPAAAAGPGSSKAGKPKVCDRCGWAQRHGYPWMRARVRRWRRHHSVTCLHSVRWLARLVPAALRRGI